MDLVKASPTFDPQAAAASCPPGFRVAPPIPLYALGFSVLCWFLCRLSAKQALRHPYFREFRDKEKHDKTVHDATQSGNPSPR
jgi:hypothetical protein